MLHSIGTSSATQASQYESLIPSHLQVSISIVQEQVTKLEIYLQPKSTKYIFFKRQKFRRKKNQARDDSIFIDRNVGRVSIVVVVEVDVGADDEDVLGDVEEDEEAELGIVRRGRKEQHRDE